MTATRINSVYLMAARLTTYFVPSDNILVLKTELLHCTEFADIEDVVLFCERVLESFSQPPTSIHVQSFELAPKTDVSSVKSTVGPNPHSPFLEEYRELIDYYFSESETVTNVQTIFCECSVCSQKFPSSFLYIHTQLNIEFNRVRAFSKSFSHTSRILCNIIWPQHNTTHPTTNLHIKSTREWFLTPQCYNMQLDSRPW